MSRSKGTWVAWRWGGGRRHCLAPTRHALQGLGTCLPPGRESAHARRRGRALAAILARAGFPPGPPAGVRCVLFPRHPTEVTRGPGSGLSSQQAFPAAAMPSVQLPPKESALFKRVLVSGRAETHPTSAHFVYLRAGLSRGSPPPHAASAASVPTAGAFQKLPGRGAGVPASGCLPPPGSPGCFGAKPGHGAPQI